MRVRSLHHNRFVVRTYRFLINNICTHNRWWNKKTNYVRINIKNQITLDFYLPFRLFKSIKTKYLLSSSSLVLLFFDRCGVRFSVVHIFDFSPEIEDTTTTIKQNETQSHEAREWSRPSILIFIFYFIPLTLTTKLCVFGS